MNFRDEAKSIIGWVKRHDECQIDGEPLDIEKWLSDRLANIAQEYCDGIAKDMAKLHKQMVKSEKDFMRNLRNNDCFVESLRSELSKARECIRRLESKKKNATEPD